MWRITKSLLKCQNCNKSVKFVNNLKVSKKKAIAISNAANESLIFCVDRSKRQIVQFAQFMEIFLKVIYQQKSIHVTMNEWKIGLSEIKYI